MTIQEQRFSDMVPKFSKEIPTSCSKGPVGGWISVWERPTNPALKSVLSFCLSAILPEIYVVGLVTR